MEGSDNSIERVNRRSSVCRSSQNISPRVSGNGLHESHFSRVSLPPIPPQPGAALKMLGRCLNAATHKIMKQENVPLFVKQVKEPSEEHTSPFARRELLIKEEPGHVKKSSFRETWKLTEESHMLSTGISIKGPLAVDVPESSILWKSIHSSVRPKSFTNILSSRPGLF